MTKMTDEELERRTDEELKKYLNSIPDAKTRTEIPTFVEVNPVEKVTQSRSFFPLGKNNQIFQGKYIGEHIIPGKGDVDQEVFVFETEDGSEWLLGKLFELKKALETEVDHPEKGKIKLSDSGSTVQIKWLGKEDGDDKTGFVKLAVHVIKW